jgi:hypothetical protein
MLSTLTVFRDWKRALLHRRNLNRPDGRPLYRYRLSNEEFDELEALLRKWLSIIASRRKQPSTEVEGFIVRRSRHG